MLGFALRTSEQAVLAGADVSAQFVDAAESFETDAAQAVSAPRPIVQVAFKMVNGNENTTTSPAFALFENNN